MRSTGSIRKRLGAAVGIIVLGGLAVVAALAWPRRLEGFTCTGYTRDGKITVWIVEPTAVDLYASEATVDLLADQATGEVEIRGRFTYFPPPPAWRVNLRPGVLFRRSSDPEWTFFTRDRQGRRVSVPVESP